MLNLLKSSESSEGINWDDFNELRVSYEKNKNIDLYVKFLEYFNSEKNKNNEGEDQKSNPNSGVHNNYPKKFDFDIKTSLDVIYSYEEDDKKREIQDFVVYFKHALQEEECLKKKNLQILLSKL